MSKEVKRFIDSLDGGFVEVIEARDYDALLEENKLLSATQYGSGRMQALRDERDALLAERDSLAEKARKFGFVEKAMEALACDEREGGIVTAASLILISSAHRMNAKRGVIDQEGVTLDDGQIGDWRVTIERIDAALQGEQP